jgi:hypothetical protein
MHTPETRNISMPKRHSTAQPFPIPASARYTPVMIAVLLLAASALSTLASAAPLHLAQATQESQSEAVPGVMGESPESAAEDHAAHHPAPEGEASGAADAETEGAEVTPDKDTMDGGMMSGGTNKPGMGMMGRGMMSGGPDKPGMGMMGRGNRGMGMMAMHGAKGERKGCSMKQEHHKDYKEARYYKGLKKQLDRIEKRQILIEAMLRAQMLGDN